MYNLFNHYRMTFPDFLNHNECLENNSNWTVHQSQCRAGEECLWFTWYRDDSLELPSLCLLLRHCDSLEKCDGCISGPRDGRDVEECFGEETTSSTAGPPSTSAGTTEMTTTGQCEMFHAAACDITEFNTVEVSVMLFLSHRLLVPFLTGETQPETSRVPAGLSAD